MKSILLTILLLCTTTARPELVTLTMEPVTPLPAGATVKARSATITLAAGDVAELVFAPIPEERDYGAAIQRLVEYVTGGQTFTWQTIVTPSGWSTAESYAYGGMPKIQPVKVTGPGTIRLISPTATTKTAATFSITRANAVPAITPSNAAVIPSDATGNFQVILESSTDLITWSAALPGTYSGTTQQRFFRSRIVRQ